MKRLTLALALALGGIFAVTQEAAAQVNFGINVRNQRYVAAGQAWVNEPYIYWQAIPDVTTGRVRVVPRTGFTRRLVWLYLDTYTSSYFYLDRLGNPVPYQRYPFPW